MSDEYCLVCREPEGQCMDWCGLSWTEEQRKTYEFERSPAGLRARIDKLEKLLRDTLPHMRDVPAGDGRNVTARDPRIVVDEIEAAIGHNPCKGSKP